MRKSELIKKLNAIEGDFEVCIFDFRKNIHNHGGEEFGISAGIEHEFSVSLENKHFKKPFIGLEFKNDDYTNEGIPDSGSSIFVSVERMVAK